MVGADKLEVRPRGGIDEQQASLHFLAWRTQKRRLADLGQLDIGQEAGKGGKLGASEVAEGIQRGNAKARFQRTLAAG